MPNVKDILTALRRIPASWLAKIIKPPAERAPNEQLAKEAHEVLEKEKLVSRLAAAIRDVQFHPIVENFTDETSEMRETYPKILQEPVAKAALLNKILAVASLEPQVQPASESPIDKDAADLVKYALGRVKGGTRSMIKTILYGGLIAGYSVSEKLFEIDKRPGRWAGKSILKDLKGKDPEFIQLLGNEFRTITTVRDRRTQKDYDPGLFVIFSHLPLYCQPTGMSDFRAAYRAYTLKQLSWRLRSIALERWTLPALKGTYEHENQKAELEEALKKVKAQGWITVPNGTLVEAMALAQRGTSDFEAAIRDLDIEIATSVCGAALQMLQGTVSDGRGSSAAHKDTAELLQWFLAAEVGDIISDQIIPDIVDQNLLGAGYPRVSFGGVNDSDLSASIAIDQQLFNMGIELSLEEMQKRYARQKPADKADTISLVALQQAQQPPQQDPAGFPGGMQQGQPQEQPPQQMADTPPGEEDMAEDTPLDGPPKPPPPKPPSPPPMDPSHAARHSNTIAKLQRWYMEGKMTREMAITNTEVVLGIHRQAAEKLFPDPNAAPVAAMSATMDGTSGVATNAVSAQGLSPNALPVAPPPPNNGPVSTGEKMAEDGPPETTLNGAPVNPFPAPDATHGPPPTTMNGAPVGPQDPTDRPSTTAPVLSKRRANMPPASPATDMAEGDKPTVKPPAAPPVAPQPKPDRLATTQFNLSPDDATALLGIDLKIDQNDLAGKGFEQSPHITVKYGIEGDNEKVRQIVDSFGPVHVKLGDTISSFVGEDHDVLKIDVEGPELRRLNKLISDLLPHQDTFPTYMPHITIGYVKPGLGKKYARKNPLAGKELVFNDIIFSDAERKTTLLPLAAPVADPEPASTPGGSPVAPEGKDVAGSHQDVSRMIELLSTSEQEGVRAVYEAASSALVRLLERGGPQTVVAAHKLFDDAEQGIVANALAKVNSTANLLGHTRVHVQMDKAHENELFLFSEDTDEPSFTSFAEPLKPLQPEAALEYFKGLVPRLGVDPVRFGDSARREAFTLAHATDTQVLQKVQKVIADRLETGQKISSAPADIEAILSAAGVSPANPHYSEMAFRTNALDAFNTGAMEAMQDPDVRDTFPIWQYLGVRDGRQRAFHQIHFNRYFSVDVPFARVRDSVKVSPFNCRCVSKPISKFKIKKLGIVPEPWPLTYLPVAKFSETACSANDLVHAECYCHG